VANRVGSSDVLGISRHRKPNKTGRKMAIGENLAESCRASVAKILIANLPLKNLVLLKPITSDAPPANQKVKSSRAAR
jgi:hypothetical protein